MDGNNQKYTVAPTGAAAVVTCPTSPPRLNLRAQNLTTFLQLADGVDDETWTYLLRRGDYSHWVRQAIKDDILADAVPYADMSGQQRTASLAEE